MLDLLGMHGNDGKKIKKKPYWNYYLDEMKTRLNNSYQNLK